MAFIEVHFYSETLTVASTVNVILPEGGQGIGVQAGGTEELPKVLYLLHGYSDDHSIWMRRTSVERYAAAHNLAVIMPAVNHSFYCNEENGEKYWDYVSEELPAMMHRFFRLSRRPEDTYVAGLSMGGYGAMRMALCHPERFAGAASFSGVMDLTEDLRDREGAMNENWHRIFGDTRDISGTDTDLIYLMRKNGALEKKPWMYISCGTEDFLYEQNKKYVPLLRENGWNVEFYEKPETTHSWSFWDEEIRTFIRMIYEK